MIILLASRTRLHPVVLAHWSMAFRPFGNSVAVHNTSRPKEASTFPCSAVATLLTSIRRISHGRFSLPDSNILFVLVGIHIIKRELRACWDIFKSEEGNIINPRVVLVVADGILPAIRLAAVVDEARRTAHILSINHVAFFLRKAVANELIETIEVALLLLRASLFAAIGLLRGDDLTKVGVDELPSDKFFVAVDAPATVRSLEDGKRHLATLLDDSAFAD